MTPGARGRAGRPGLAGLVRRAGWNVVDQALSSLSNLVLSILVARAVDAQAFGAFTVSFTVYSIAVLVSRALVSEPLMMRHSADPVGVFRGFAGMSAGAAVALGLASGAVVLVVGVVVGGAAGQALCAMALLLPGLLLQDAWRMAFLSHRRPELAALLDGTWMALQVGAVAWLLAEGHDSTVPYLLAWGLAAAAAGVLGAQQGRSAPNLLRAGAWVRRHWDITRFLVLETLLAQGAAQGALLMVGALGSLSDVGALRGAQVLLGPVALLTASALAFGIPELSSRTGLSVRQQMGVAALLGGALAAAGVVWGTVTLLFPPDVGTAVMGDSWSGVRSVLLASIVGQVGVLVAVGAACVVYAMGQVRYGFWIHVVVSVLLVGLGMGGLALGGAEGAAWGFAAANWLVVPLWFVVVLRLSRAEAAKQEQVTPERALP